MRLFIRLFSSSAAASAIAAATPKLKNLSYRHRGRALTEARLALTEYLHSTRALPFAHAELIALHSPISLSSLVSQISFPDHVSAVDIPRFLRRFLSYRPVDEFAFFLESIGLYPLDNSSEDLLFLSDDRPLLAALSAFVAYGFPWTRLGVLYRNCPVVFRTDPETLIARLRSFEALGLRRSCIIAACLAFPNSLMEDSPETEFLVMDLKTVFVDFSMSDHVGDNVDDLLEICYKIKVFYDMGSVKGRMGELMGRNRKAFLEIDASSLEQKLRFFINLGMEEQKAGIFLLGNPEILYFDLDSCCISMPGYLKNIGLGEKEADALSKRYTHVMGKNKLQNLPGLLRAINMHAWFLAKIVDDNHHYLLPECSSSDLYDLELENNFVEDIERISSAKKYKYVGDKLEFLLSIGFGKNKATTRALSVIHGTREQLQDRFDGLLKLGVNYSMLCRMISVAPKILNQSTEMLSEKVNYLCNDLGYKLEYLDSFPAFLCFDLENRIKPRYRILRWLKENGLTIKLFAPATVLANSEKRFMVNLYSIHPAAPKLWLESFSSRIQWNGETRNLF